MISNSETAKQISDLLLATFYKLDASCDEVQKSCSPDEAVAYKRAVGSVACAIVMDVLEPLYARHPELKPANWDEQ
jgi:hypothetical protein